MLQVLRIHFTSSRVHLEFQCDLTKHQLAERLVQALFFVGPEMCEK